VHQRDEGLRAGGIERRHFVDVRPADEGLLAGPGQHDGAQVVAAAERLDRIHERDHEGAPERVELGGVVDGHAGDHAACALVQVDADRRCRGRRGRGLSHGNLGNSRGRLAG